MNETNQTKVITFNALGKYEKLRPTVTPFMASYATMKEMQQLGKLIPGQLYRITDYVTTITQADTQSAGHQFDIMVVALNETTLSEEAWAIQHDGDTYFKDSRLEAWQLKYRLDNEDVTESGKGTITWMKDEWGNEAAYDFKNIQQKRWKVTDELGRSSIDGKYLGVLNNLPEKLSIEDESDFIWAYLYSVYNYAGGTQDTTDHSLTGNVYEMVANFTVDSNNAFVWEDDSYEAYKSTFYGSVRNCSFFGNIQNSIISGQLNNLLINAGNGASGTINGLYTLGKIDGKTITVPTNAAYPTYAAMTTEGQMKTWNPADSLNPIESLGAYDISAAHASGGVLATYADLTAALGTNGANIPEGIRKGGMSVKFVLSSDNKYIQYFCNSQTFTTNVNAWERMNLEDEVLNSSIYFKDYVPDANKRITELYLIGLDTTKRYYFKYLGQYYNGSDYSEIHVSLYEFTQSDKSDEQVVCSFFKTGTEPISAKGIIKLSERDSSGIYGWAIINIPSDIRNDVSPEIDINICSNILNSPVLAGISPATESSTIKTTDGIVIANINGVNLYSGLPYVSRLSGGNERVRELYITGVNNAHTYRLLTFSSGAYVGVNLYDQTDNNKYVAGGYKSETTYEGIVELTERNSSGISAYAFVKVGAEAPQIYGVVDLTLATDLGANPIIQHSITPAKDGYYKYRNANVSITLFEEGKYVRTNGTFVSSGSFNIIKIEGNDLKEKLTLLHLYTLGWGICAIGAYKSDGTFIKSIFNLPDTSLGYYNYYLDLTTVDYSELGYLLLSVSSSQVIDNIICLIEQYKEADFYFSNKKQEIKENHIYIKADGTTPKLSETLLGITDSGYYNRYFIHLSNGIYDILDGISHVEDPATNPYGDGVWVKDYVSIIGDGEIENTIIKCELDPSVDTQTTTQDGYTISIMEKISTINASSNSKIENVTITAKNCRYAIHSDYSPYQMENTELIFENCKVIHYGDTAGWPIARQVSSPACYGGGIRKGQKRIFKNCDFIAYQSTPWFTHNEPTMDKDAFIELNGCRFINLTENINLDSVRFPSVKFMSYGVTANVYTKIVGCLINNSIKVQETTLSGHTTKGTDYIIIGNGNNVPVQYEEKTSTNVPRNKYCVKFSDEGFDCINRTSSLISLGTAVKMNDNGTIEPLGVGDENLFIGFANEDIDIDEIGYIKTKGFYSLKDLGISAGNWAVGTKFKLNGSSVVQDNTGNLIVKTYGYLYL